MQRRHVACGARRIHRGRVGDGWAVRLRLLHPVGCLLHGLYGAPMHLAECRWLVASCALYVASYMDDASPPLVSCGSQPDRMLRVASGCVAHCTPLVACCITLQVTCESIARSAASVVVLLAAALVSARAVCSPLSAHLLLPAARARAASRLTIHSPSAQLPCAHSPPQYNTMRCAGGRPAIAVRR